MALSRQKQVAEIIKCGKEPVYFFNTYVKIQHSVKGLIPFDTYPFQDDCVKSFIGNRFNIVLKSRQQGLSTLVAAYAVWMAIFQKEKNILIIATKLSVAQNFITKVKSMIRGLPKWLMLPEITANNKQQIYFNNGSQIKAIPTSEDAGRSESLSLLIVDEAAFVRNFDTIWTGIYPTISTGGRAILLSTPNGVGGQYYKLYTDAEAGLNEFNPIKIMWHENPDYNQEWFEQITANMSKRQIAQEYLCDFTTSGDTFLGSDELEWIRTCIKEPIDKGGEDRNVWIWKYPLSEHEYIISADVSRGDSKDYSTFHVFDTTESEVVAEYKGKIRPDNFAELLCEWGHKYNKALLCPENNSFGYASILKIQEMQYPRLYYRQRKGVYLGDYVPKSSADVAGFTTNGKTRSMILGKLEETLRNKQLLIRSSRSYEELKTFSWSTGRAEAKRGYNDDLVISLAIGSWLFDSSSDYSKNSKELNSSMLKAMSLKTTTYDDTPECVVNHSYRDSDKTNVDKKSKLRFKGSRNSSKISSDYMWVIK